MKLISSKSALMMLTGLLCAAVVLPGCGKKETKPDPVTVEKKVEEAPAEPSASEKLTAACDGGDAASCSNLAMMYEKGEGVDKSEEKALELYSKSCDLGAAASCHVAGIWNTKAANHEAATTLYTKACEGSYFEGCYHLGLNYEKGWGVAQDPTEANRAYKKACAGGFEKACEKGN